MSRESKLLASIASTAENVRLNRRKVVQHKKYFAELANDHKIMLTIMLLPAFLSGWRSGKKVNGVNWLKQFLKFGVMTALTQARRFYRLV